MITASSVANVAEETGFRPEVVEKVLRLSGILARLDRHEVARDVWLLKGGTALNLLHDRLLDEGTIDAPALADDPAIQERIGKQPMLLWRAWNVRKHRGIEPPVEHGPGD